MVKKKIIEKHRRHDSDTGSAEVQIALISSQIDQLATHLKKHRKDNHSRRGLLGMVAKRRSLLSYLERREPKVYTSTIKKLGLKK
jgi:small subunit ribosomal protein S15